MRRILRRREMVADDWSHLGEEAAEGAALIVPLAELRKDAGRWWQWSGRLGVRITPIDRVEELARRGRRRAPGPGVPARALRL